MRTEATSGAGSNASTHPLGGPPGQMWKKAIEEAQGGQGAQGAQGASWIPPGQRKKMEREQAQQQNQAGAQRAGGGQQTPLVLG